ncbi:CTP synthase [Prochlorothrix hollandica]|uniref:CTP synthase n=1 Tax=Prochlorothrix hollandica TaxID=1223 RepID=UPI00034AFA23|nr:CTP synthase [Prochlorothrix hollandica]
MKIIFVASDFSGLGKGTFGAALGRLLRSHGMNVRIMKCDLYYNYDAGTINPKEHGEVYVLSNGLETDQDLGIYERYLDVECNSYDYVTSGQIHHQIYLNERSGQYLGQTVSFEHVIEEITRRISRFAEQCDVGIVEIGATIGDIKGVFFLEACRQLRAELGRVNSTFVLLSHFPYLPSCGELKTMGCQRSVNDLRSKGLKPDVLVARTPQDVKLDDYLFKKIELFCEVPRQAVVQLADIENSYEIPLLLRSLGLQDYLASHMELKLGEDTLNAWYKKFDLKRDLKIALVGKYSHADAYVSILHQLRFLGIDSVEYLSNLKLLTQFDAVIIPGGWGKRGTEEMIEAARVCRENRIPCLGICLGLQIMAIEYSRNVLGLEGANSTEFDDETPYPVVVMQDAQKEIHGLGGTARLGDWVTQLVPGSLAASIYGSEETTQRHRHRYEISSDIEFGNFKVTGRDKKTNLVEVMELPDHPFYLGVQFHPEFKPGRNPVFEGLVKAAENRKVLNSQDLRSLKSALYSGTPGTFFECLNINQPQELRQIVDLDDDQLQHSGISYYQQKILREFLKIWDEKQNVIEELEREISTCEREMRQININEKYSVEHMPLSEFDRRILTQLRKETETKTQKLKELRFFYQEQMQRFDEEMSRTFQSEVVPAIAPNVVG